jgi:dihydroxyacetone kinase-like predicted kinase
VNVPVLEQLGADALRHTLVTYRDTLKRHQTDLNKLNVYPVPDGDTGTNMARTLDAVVAELDKHPGALDETCNAISHGSLMGARGNSGVILSQILRGLSATLKSAREHGAPKVAEALKAASVAAYDSVLKPIEGTILEKLQMLQCVPQVTVPRWRQCCEWRAPQVASRWPTPRSCCPF